MVSLQKLLCVDSIISVKILHVYNCFFFFKRINFFEKINNFFE